MDESAFLVDLDSMTDINDMTDMDDLFVDDPPVVVAPAPQPVILPQESSALLSRLEELHSSNACQKLAWSRLGALAAVSPDGRSVKVHVYARDMTRDQSSLYTIQPTTIVLPMSPHEIVHVSWDPMGSILVVVDAVGGVCIYTTIICLNRLENYSHYDCRSQDHTMTVVGLEWFDLMRQMCYYHAAQRHGDSWKFLPAMTRPYGPTHPMQQKQAALAVSRDGSLRLIFGQPDYAFGYARATLDGISSAEQLLTHAAMAPEHSNTEQKMILATHDYAHTIRVYHVWVDWKLSSQYRGKPGMPNLPPSFRFDPQLGSRPITSVSAVAAADAGGTTVQLSHLMVLPEVSPDGSSRPLCSPTVLAVVTAVVALPSFQLGHASAGRRCQISRWELVEAAEELHSAFEQLHVHKTANANSGAEKSRVLKQLPDVHLPSVVVAATFSHTLNQLILTYHDGSVEFRDRNTLELIQPSPKSPVIRSPREAGLSFANDGLVIHSAMSANHYMAACRGEDKDDIVINLLTQHETQEAPTSEENSAALAALILGFASSTTQNKNNDDILANLHVLVSSGRVSSAAAMSCMFGSIDLSLDALAENLEADQERVNRLLSQSPLIRCLSLQQMLHTRAGVPDGAAQLARVVLNVRAAVLSIQIALRSIGTNQEGTIDTPASILGVAQYLLTLFLFLAGEILDMHRTAPEPVTREWAQARIDASQTPILPLLASAPRFFLRFSCRALRSMIERARVSREKPGVAHHRSWCALADLADGCGVGLKFLESLLLELDHYARQAYISAGLDERQRAEVELQCMTTGEIPKELMPVVQRLVTTSAAKLAAEKECDPMALFFADVRALDLTDDRETRKMHGRDTEAANGGEDGDSRAELGQRWDVIRKTPLSLPRAGTWRRCSRCCSVMEHMQLRLCSQWVIGMQKNCVCGSAWVIDGNDAADESGIGGTMAGFL